MAHRQFVFPMPASVDVVFDAFHYYEWRVRWDSLVSRTQVDGGAACPSVGAITHNTGAGLLRGLAMRTEFIQYNRPHSAAARMLGQAFPFTRWAASMRHRPDEDGQSLLLYSYTLTVGNPDGGISRWMEPVVDGIFAWQTRRRFARLRTFLAHNAAEVAQWQAKVHSPAAP